MSYEMLKWLISTAFVLTLLVCGMAWRVTKGLGRRPLSPITLLRYRGKTTGTVESVDRQGCVAIISYEVDGQHYRYVAPYQVEKRTVARDMTSAPMGDFAMPTDWHDYETTSLGRIYPGGSIGMRFDIKNPSRAVAVPNPHNPMLRG